MLYEFCVLAIFPIAMIFAAATDALSYKISNHISVIIVLGFIVLVPFSGMSISVIVSHVVTAAIVLVIGFILFARGWIGGGDAKVISAAVLWLGPGLIVPFLLIMAIAGGVLSVICLMVRQVPIPIWLAERGWLINWQTGVGSTPYGIAITFTALLLYPQSSWLGLS